MMIVKFFIFMLILSCTGCSSINTVKKVKHYDVTQMKQNLLENSTYVDVVVIHTTHSVLTWKQLKKEFIEAQKVYEKYGVHLNLIRAYQIDIPKKWHHLNVDSIKGQYIDEDIDFYDKLEAKKKWLSDRALSIFNQLIDKEKYSHRTIYLLALNKVHMGVLDKRKDGEIKDVNFRVGALSFPSYIYADRIPKHLRGVITIGRNSEKSWVVAHELAHKLINASHEGLSSCPKFSGSTIPGILGYKGETDIYAGKKGRWHLERLKRSPYLYRVIKGEKHWNPDYKNSGGYRDTIYGDYVVTPACPVH